MPAASSPRSDFVMGMSLAEIVLLMAFCLLLLYVGILESTGGIDAPVDAHALKEENEKLKNEIVQLKQKVSELEIEIKKKDEEIELIARMVGADGRDYPAIKRAIMGIKLGHPPCSEKNNTLVEISVFDGTIALVALSEEPSLIQDLDKRGIKISLGQPINRTDQIDNYLKAVLDFEGRNNCRFHYRLRYKTSDDYQWAREKYETSIFYPYKRTKIQ